MTTYLITGANRGLGLELTTQLLAQGEQVVATSRSSSPALEELIGTYKNLEHFKFDVSSDTDRDHVRASLRKPIDVLIANAGVLRGYQDGISDLNSHDLTHMFDVNVIGVVRTIQACLPMLRQSKKPKIICISSKVGSISDNQSGKAYGYRSSKTALNMINKSLSIELKDQGITSIVLHPGWVQTDMGGENAPLTPKDSIAGIIELATKLNIKDTGKFYEYNGNEIPW